MAREEFCNSQILTLMENKSATSLPLSLRTLLVVFVFLGGNSLYQMIQVNRLTSRVATLEGALAYTASTLSENTNELSRSVTDLNKKTIGLSYSLTNTQQNVDAVKSVVGGVQQTVGSISSTVGTLKKLSEVDPMLLKKYSKVYFLNENYSPPHLVPIPINYLYNEKKEEQFLSEAWPSLQMLLNTANASGVTLYVKSGYRSFAEQKSLKSSYAVTYGKGTANAFSADQGYSEHQLGTTLDFITTGTGGSLDGFDTTQAFTWLINNGYKYGFVLSYPKGNSYYVYEPWHWRYVGIKLATYLHNTNKYFYDLDQRDIDTYLINVFE